VLAALEIQELIFRLRQREMAENRPYWQIRVGIHSGDLVAGVVGSQKFSYDVWGDTVNTASRLESSGAPGRINISPVTRELVKDFFECDFRGKVAAKNKGEIGMYFVIGIHPELSLNGKGREPDEKFFQKYRELTSLGSSW
jgi:class 3 adenylate cyclase